jgi:hypothetical protein
VKQLAPGVWRLKELPLPVINIYLAEDVLIDAGRETGTGVASSPRSRAASSRCWR